MWLDRAPANNTWLIAVRGDLARRERLGTMDDFAQLARRGGAIKLAGSAEFVESPAALPSFEKTYGFNLPPRPDRDPARRRHRGDDARRRRSR